VARYLLTSTSARDLEIAAAGIEEAFLALTGDDPQDGAPDDSATSTGAI
jgi:ABC-2 type transport system ATP-binding protein